jgi:hypothetical protein
LPFTHHEGLQPIAIKVNKGGYIPIANIDIVEWVGRPRTFSEDRLGHTAIVLKEKEIP